MTEAWRVLARNYAKFSPPLTPNDETVVTLRTCLPLVDDPHVVVLGATPLFGKLAHRVTFIDAAADALSLVELASDHRIVNANWLTAAEEYGRADLVVGDGAVNALDRVETVTELLQLLKRSMRPGTRAALRTFLQHGMPADEFERRLLTAFESNSFSEVRLLLYGVVAEPDGATTIADIDRFIAELSDHVALDAEAAAGYAEKYFDWRGLTATAAARITSTGYFPTREGFARLIDSIGLRAQTLSAGTFPLAECSPIYSIEF